MKKKYLIVIFLITIFIMFLLSTSSYAGTQKLNDLNYDVTLNADGSVDVTETWDIRVSETNTLFKTFDIDKTKYGEITDVTVEEITKSGEKISFKDTGVYAYHVQKGGYYALTRNANREFEIAWGVSIENTENKTYEIKYKIYDAIKTYEDCSEFYWQFIGDTNGVPAKKVTGIIKLENGVQNKQNLRAWAHGPLDGKIEIIDNNTVLFEVPDLQTETMVEIRLVTTENVFTENENIREIDRFDKILSEETKWANEANEKRDRAMKVYIIIAILSIGVLLFFVINIIKYIKKLREVSKPKEQMNIEYFRDFPDEDATPAEAAFIYYFEKEAAFKSNVSKIVSATILSLALKKALSFEQGEKNNIFIVLNENANLESLKTDEKSIYSLLVDIKEYMRKKNKEELSIKISMKDIEKYAKNYDTKFLAKVEGLEKIAQQAEGEKGNYDEKLIEGSKKWKNKSASYYIVAICLISTIFFVVPIFIMIPCFICGYLCSKIAQRTRYLTQKGTEERIKWRGLKKYMEEFSLLNEREVPELVLWEKYLVFATAFGISDKVIEQLKVKYPQILDENYMMTNGFIYMHMVNRMNFTNAINTGMQKAYSSGVSARAAKNYSSSRRIWWRIFWWRSEAGGGGGRNGRKIEKDKNLGRSIKNET